jgi:FkbM family methyltransferase
MVNRQMSFFRRPAKSVRYRVGEVDLHLPNEHTLPIYQARHPLYDRFISVLGEVLPDTGLLIDVGANVGDTAAALCRLGRKKIICIEASPNFFTLLTENTAHLQSQGHEVFCKRAIVGTPGNYGVIDETTSTGSFLASAKGAPVCSLDELISPYLSENSDITLLKIDTDGSDADIILSASTSIEAHTPLLFWEADINTPEALHEHSRALEFLADAGYSMFSLFDNFGNLLLESSDTGTLVNVYEYLLRLKQGVSTRTFHYVDVLASNPRFREIHERSISQYRAQFLTSS